ncbi:MAG TPA: DUF5946 family protein [Acidobacteriaceae bacterium]|nr:DUF5946 family protein [Acidobacteriaceae bacterium]
MATDEERFDELSFYTLAQPRPPFIHQLAIDAFTAQRADESTRPMAVIFALLGLYLHVEYNFTGLQVQEAHMRLARVPRSWPSLPLPRSRGSVEVAHVLAAEPGPPRDAMIHAWCESVWQAWQASRPAIAELVRRELGVG